MTDTPDTPVPSMATHHVAMEWTQRGHADEPGAKAIFEGLGEPLPTDWDEWEGQPSVCDDCRRSMFWADQARAFVLFTLLAVIVLFAGIYGILYAEGARQVAIVGIWQMLGVSLLVGLICTAVGGVLQLRAGNYAPRQAR